MDEGNILQQYIDMILGLIDHPARRFASQFNPFPGMDVGPDMIAGGLRAARAAPGLARNALGGLPGQLLGQAGDVLGGLPGRAGDALGGVAAAGGGGYLDLALGALGMPPGLATAFQIGRGLRQDFDGPSGGMPAAQMGGHPGPLGTPPSGSNPFGPPDPLPPPMPANFPGPLQTGQVRSNTINTGATPQARRFYNNLDPSVAGSTALNDVYRNRGITPEFDQLASQNMRQYGDSLPLLAMMLAGDPNAPDRYGTAERLTQALARPGGQDELGNMAATIESGFSGQDDLRRQMLLGSGEGGMLELMQLASQLRGDLPEMTRARAALAQRELGDARRAARAGSSGTSADLTPEERLAIMRRWMSGQQPVPTAGSQGYPPPMGR